MCDSKTEYRSGGGGYQSSSRSLEGHVSAPVSKEDNSEIN